VLVYFFAAQDIDSVPSVQKRSLASIADEIADPAERSAFLQLFKPAAPAEMRARAEAFSSRFPRRRSWRKPMKWQPMAPSKSVNTTSDSVTRKTLFALLPENPLLLVPVADVEARQTLNSAAIAHAREALDDSIASPGLPPFAMKIGPM